MRKYFLTNRCELAYVNQAATTQYWDTKWGDDASRRRKASQGSKRAWVVRITKQYLKPEDGILIEGGCGLADKVDSLVQAGYRCIGIDFAEKTVSLVKNENPLLDVRLGDVRNLQLPDEKFIGYWSLGVIEHFWNGYRDIAEEMHRVLKPGGILFLTFPFMNDYRTRTAPSRYPPLVGNEEPNGFYQFALKPLDVEKHFTAIGFDLVAHRGFAVLSGLRDERDGFRRYIDFILNMRNRNILTKGLFFALNSVLESLLGDRYGHSILMVMRKRA